MEVANELKRLTNDAYTVGLYDEEEARIMVENSMKITAEKQGLNKGLKQGIKQGASNEKKLIAKNLLNMGISKKNVMKATGLSKKQITMLM